MTNRDDFTQAVKDKLAKRVNYICSNPECCRGTIAPAIEEDKIINIGVAAHICAAAPGGKRYNPNMSHEERRDISNGIWLCSSCSNMIDRDEKKYTVDLLKKWKAFSENRAQEALVKPLYELTELEKKVLTEIVPVNLESDLLEDEERNYSELYKEYVNKFEVLKEYLYNKTIFNKIDERYNNNEDVYLVFGRKILDWLIGENEFPTYNLIKFYEKLSEDYNFSNTSLIKRRWDAIIAYFNNDIENAKKIYFELYDSIQGNGNIPFWFKDDIYIDGRNINNLLDNINGIYRINNIFQQQIDKNKHKLSYPGLDRIRCDVYENSIEKVIDYKNKSANTKMYGIGLGNILDLIQEAVYISILYGSITQLKLVRNVFSNVMALYAECFKEEKFYKLTLKLKVLSGSFGDYKKIYNTIRYKYKFVNTKEFIDELFILKKAILKFDINYFYSFFFEIYGRNVNEKQYIHIEKEILNIIDDKKEINPNIIDKALKSIPNNTIRFNNKQLLFTTMLNYVKKGYSRFYMEFGPILNNIKVNELDNKEEIVFIELVDACYKLDNVDLLRCITGIKKLTKTNKYDEYLNELKSSRGIINKINNGDNIEALEEMVKEISLRANKREEQPGLHIGYGYIYNIDKFFTKTDYNLEMKKFFVSEIIPLASKILESHNQYITDKIIFLKTFSNVLSIESSDEIVNKCQTLLDKIEINSAKEPFGDTNKNENDIKINILLVKYLLGKIKLNELLHEYLRYGIDDKDNFEEIINCLLIIAKTKKISKTDTKLIYLIYSLSINKRNIKITECAIRLMNVFMDTEFHEIIESDLEEIISYNNYDELVSILDMLYNLNKKGKSKFDKIINILKSNTNYNIKYMIKKYLD